MAANNDIFQGELHTAAQANYHPQNQVAAECTISESRKQAAVDADPQKGRCLISGDRIPVQTCHVLPRATHGDLLTKLEWAWGRPYHSLHVDTHLNLIHLNYNLHRLFDDEYWFLIPEAHVVEQVVQYTTRAQALAKKNPPRQNTDIEKVFGKRLFKYYFVPTPRMRGSDVIIRRRILGDKHVPVRKPHVPTKEHVYPFDTLPFVKSHVLPHFVMYNAGTKMLDLSNLSLCPPELEGAIPGLASTLATILFQHLIWTKTRVPIIFDRGLPDKSGRLPQVPPSGDESSQGEPPAKRTRNAASASSNRTSQAGSSASELQHGSYTHAVTTPDSVPSDEDLAIDGADVEMDEDDFEDDEEIVEEDDAAFENRMHSWEESSATIAKTEGWEKNILNDSQLGEYVEEPSRRVSEVLRKSSVVLSASGSCPTPG